MFSNCLQIVFRVSIWIIACRRYMSNVSLFNTMTDVASTVPGTKMAVGGNAPVMVNHILREGVRVLLGASMTESLRKHIGPNVEGNSLVLGAFVMKLFLL